MHALESFFKFKANGTTLARDTVAGLTTFVVMSYIIFVNPGILGLPTTDKGLPFAAALTSTCLVAGVLSILMGLVTNRAFAMAPGMGLNAIVAYQLVLGEGLSMGSAMGIVVLEGVVITVLVLVGLREAVFDAVPTQLKRAVGVGIGFFILFIGLVNGGLVRPGPGPEQPVDLGDLVGVPVAVTAFGLAVTIIMMARRWKVAILLGIVLSTALATILNYVYDKKAFPADTGWAVVPSDVWAKPDFGLVGHFDFGAFAELGVIAACLWVFSVMLSDFFDTMGSVIGVGEQAGYLDEEGNLPDIKPVLIVDSLGAVAGGVCSSASATTYVESGAGVGVGGRSGWVTVVTGLCFLAAMPFSPLAAIVPPQATAAALIVVGYLMMMTLSRPESPRESDGPLGRLTSAIDFSDLSFGLPAVLIMTVMPLTWSITNGIGAGFLSYVLIRLVRGEARKVPWLLWVFAGAFLLYFVFPLMRQEFGW